MAPAQMALPMERRNGSTPRPATPAPARPAEHVESVEDTEPAAPKPVATVPAPEAVSVVPVWVRRTTTVGVLVVALVAAIGSYEHMRALGVEVGEGWRAGLLPFSVDGLALVAAMTMLVRRWNGQRAGLLAWTALVASLGVSLAANVAAAQPTVEARMWAAWPPLGLLLAMELLMQQIKARGGPGVQTVRPGAFQPLDGRTTP